MNSYLYPENRKWTQAEPSIPGALLFHMVLNISSVDAVLGRLGLPLGPVIAFSLMNGRRKSMMHFLKANRRRRGDFCFNHPPLQAVIGGRWVPCHLFVIRATIKLLCREFMMQYMMTLT
jgi:hypothetical protein